MKDEKHEYLVKQGIFPMVHGSWA